MLILDRKFKRKSFRHNILVNFLSIIWNFSQGSFHGLAFLSLFKKMNIFSHDIFQKGVFCWRNSPKNLLTPKKSSFIDFSLWCFLNKRNFKFFSILIWEKIFLLVFFLFSGTRFQKQTTLFFNSSYFDGFKS